MQGAKVSIALRSVRGLFSMGYKRSSENRCENGQSVLEAALVLPLLLTLACNAINVGYYFYASLNLTAAPRQGSEYAIQGGIGSLQNVLPSSANVKNLVVLDINGAMAGTVNATPIQVCSSNAVDGGFVSGTAGTNTQAASCTSWVPSGLSATFAGADSDPESPNLVVQRVDIQYTIPPLISGPLFNLVPPPTYVRTVQMRAIE